MRRLARLCYAESASADRPPILTRENDDADRARHILVLTAAASVGTRLVLHADTSVIVTWGSASSSVALRGPTTPPGLQARRARLVRLCGSPQTVTEILVATA